MKSITETKRVSIRMVEKLININRDELSIVVIGHMYHEKAAHIVEYQNIVTNSEQKAFVLFYSSQASSTTI